MGKPSGKKIWIDLDNSPHVLFFNPVIKELKSRGYQVIVTARDYAQVIELAKLFNIETRVIGRHYGKNMWLKAWGVLTRALSLIWLAIRERPTLALNHGSRSQVIAANLTGIRIMVATDYEHATRLPLFRANYLVVPEVIKVNRNKTVVYQYPGIKEDVYKHNLVPDPGILSYLGIKQDQVVIAIRPPATVAHYHTAKSDNLFEAIIDHICANPLTKAIILPRIKEQEEFIKKKWSEHFETGKLMVPAKVLDGLNLIWHSDLVVSGGGTMIREAAALGIPAYSTFGGTIGAVDHYLEKTGRLVIIKNEDDIMNKVLLIKRNTPQKLNGDAENSTLSKIIEIIEKGLN